MAWFSPRGPVSTWEKTWTETRMSWLAERLGLARLLDAEVVLPTNDYFPRAYEGTLQDARRFMTRLCRYMGIDRRKVGLVVRPDASMPHAAGQYRRRPDRERAVIRVKESILSDPEALLATLAHELAHEVLIGGGLLDDTVPDHEWITDLLPVYLGVGVFGANATIREAYGGMGWWMRRQGYLPSRMLGYAMALFAFVRGEETPAWASFLRADAATALEGGLRYLREAEDCLFHPDTAGQKQSPLTAFDAVERLQSGSPSIRLATLWQIQERRLTEPKCLEAVTACLDDADADIAADAARTLAVFGSAAAPALPKLRAALRGAADAVRAGAAHALGELALERESVVPDLCCLVGMGSRGTQFAVAQALGRLGTQVDAASVQRLLAQLRTALIECDYEMIHALARALLAASPAPESAVRDFFAADEELLALAFDALREAAA